MGPLIPSSRCPDRALNSPKDVWHLSSSAIPPWPANLIHAKPPCSCKGSLVPPAYHCSPPLGHSIEFRSAGPASCSLCSESFGESAAGDSFMEDFENERCHSVFEGVLQNLQCSHTFARPARRASTPSSRHAALSDNRPQSKVAHPIQKAHMD